MSRGRRGPIHSAPRRLGEAFLEMGKVVKAERERPVEDQAKVDVALRSRIAPRKRPEKNNLADGRESARFFADRLFYDRRVEVPGFAYFVEDLPKKAFDFSEPRVVAGFPVAIQAKPQEMKGRIGLGNPVFASICDNRLNLGAGKPHSDGHSILRGSVHERPLPYCICITPSIRQRRRNARTCGRAHVTRQSRMAREPRGAARPLSLEGFPPASYLGNGKSPNEGSTRSQAEAHRVHKYQPYEDIPVRIPVP